MNDFTSGQLTELCQMVYTGTKPCAMIPVMIKNLQAAKIICGMRDCKFKSVELSEGWVTFWVYIRDEISDIIDLLPENPKTKADHYLLGALFGYSNEAICNYIKNEPK